MLHIARNENQDLNVELNLVSFPHSLIQSLFYPTGLLSIVEEELVFYLHCAQ